ncbi:MAG: polysaccharide deacetylase family protein [Wenzhouxiangella sp.]|jgi:peptidoglycan/xylan/chitin deacetylase (PgdA/CDA1 family)|nr:polysaccharide deacetylase family protein [Wenzhouxiangella sp.]
MSAAPETMPAPGRVLVLMYHGIHAGRASRGHFDPRYSVHPDRFREQVEYLHEYNRVGWLPVAGEALLAPPSARDHNMVLITFDDGDASLVDAALPVLAEAGLGAVFFVTRNFVGQRGMINVGELRQLSAAGMVIGSHGVSHRFLNTLSAAALEFELEHSRAFLEQSIGREVSLLSLPGGRGGKREIEAAARAGYRSVFGSVPGDNRNTAPGQVIERVAVTHDVTLERFRQIVHWKGSAAWRIQARHLALRWPKRLIGDRGYDWLRNAWVRGT